MSRTQEELDKMPSVDVRGIDRLYLEDRTPTFRRHVRFEKGYNYLHETGPKRRGQHGMGIRFVLAGPEGATQFLMNTSWTPLGEVDKDAKHNEPCHIDPDGLITRNYGVGEHTFGMVHAPSGYDLGYHWRTPQYEGQEPGFRRCEWLGGPCYYDGSGLAGEEVLRDFISQGEPAVWRWLIKRYRWCLEEEAAIT